MVEETKEPKKVAAEITGEGQAIPVRHRAKFVPDETLMSHELRKKLWDGLIPLKIDLALGDIITMEKPRSLYLMAPRENYLFFILNDVKSLFDSYGPAEHLEKYNTMWFEFNGKDLKWNIPIGVQFDTAVGLTRKKDETPWCLTFHYKDNPSQHQMVHNAMKTFHFNFMHSLKESQCLRMDDANEIQQFLVQKDEKKMIEDGLFKNNYEAFWQQNHKHLFKHIGDIKRYAIRVLCNNHHTFVQLNKPQPPLPVDQDGNIVDENSESFQKWYEEASSFSIGQLLLDSFPKLFDETLQEESATLVVEPSKPGMEVLTQGVKLDMSTQVYWMQMNLCYPDGFVYLSFHFPQN